MNAILSVFIRLILPPAKSRGYVECFCSLLRFHAVLHDFRHRLLFLARPRLGERRIRINNRPVFVQGVSGHDNGEQGQDGNDAIRDVYCSHAAAASGERPVACQVGVGQRHGGYIPAFTALELSKAKNVLGNWTIRSRLGMTATTMGAG